MTTAIADVKAGEDSPHGLPEPGELSAATRLIVGGSALADIALRTYAATLVSATATIPYGIGRALTKTAHIERDNVRFYRQLAQRADPATTFPRPTENVTVTATRSHSRFQPRDGRVEIIRFRSPYRPANPAMRQQWACLTRNNHAVAQYWHHADRPRPTVAIIHGFMASMYHLNSAFFAVPWLYQHGYDVLLFTMPFHGRRQEWFSPFSGHGFFHHGIGGICEAMSQAVHDFRLFVDYLIDRGVDKIGVTGISLGGYTCALLAAVDDRLAFAVPNVPLADMSDVIDRWPPAGQAMDLMLRLGDIPRTDVGTALASHSPLTYRPILPKDRLFIITGLGDRLAPPDHAQRLWEHWDRPTLHWFPGNHIMHVNRAAYLKRMRRFMRATGFSAGTERSR
ncbi:MAG: prolyl oligopeptidase family serine peptidase [Sciscionella sp.]|nr:prolyl oligopeptidase family serine peptidase [Sciscionella sp.]